MKARPLSGATTHLTKAGPSLPDATLPAPLSSERKSHGKRLFATHATMSTGTTSTSVVVVEVPSRHQTPAHRSLQPKRPHTVSLAKYTSPMTTAATRYSTRLDQNPAQAGSLNNSKLAGESMELSTTSVTTPKTRYALSKYTNIILQKSASVMMLPTP